MKPKDIRDEFAMAALQGMLAGAPAIEEIGEVKINSARNLMKAAYGIADCALEEREKSDKK